MKLLMKLERLMKIAPARTPDQVRTTSTPPTWRAKDVEGNCPPRTPMGPEPLVCAVRGRREHEEQIEADARAVFTQVRAARMRKTLLLLGCVLSLGARSLKKQLHERENDLGFQPNRTPSTLCMGLLL